MPMILDTIVSVVRRRPDGARRYVVEQAFCRWHGIWGAKIMSSTDTMTDTGVDAMGPIDYLVIEFPGNKMTGEGIPLLLDLVERGIIRIMDLGFLTKAADGSVTAIHVEDMDADHLGEFAVFQGAATGLLDSDDYTEAGDAIQPGNSAGIIVYENLWAAPLAAAWRRGGAQVVASGRIQVQALLAALDSADQPGAGG
jgi:hypothetical protein